MKKIVSLLIAFTLIFALPGCGGQEGPPAQINPPAPGPEPSAPASAWEPANIREHTFVLAHGMSAESQVGQQYHAFALSVEKLSEGKIKIEEKIDGILVNDRETLDAVINGRIDFCHSMGSYVTDVVTDISPMTIAGYYGGSNWIGFATDTHNLISAIYEEHGIKYLGALYQGNSVIACTEKQIKSPSDVEDLAFRASGTWVSKTIEAWGGTAITIGLPDLAAAFRDNAVQGTATGMNIIVPFKIYEEAKYITVTTITEGFAALLMNGDTWGSLNADEQALIAEAGSEFVKKAYDIAVRLVDEYIRTVKSQGLNEVYNLTPEEQQLFIERAYSLYPQMEPALGEKGEALIILLKQINGIK
ncbi:MAG: TRAP transporter substrate-binding protein DctP [Peptococcaceae bacterium]|nr:TRAP transporter substrate-binding protein DctP [Peptococcaceae bacterium]